MCAGYIRNAGAACLRVTTQFPGGSIEIVKLFIRVNPIAFYQFQKIKFDLVCATSITFASTIRIFFSRVEWLRSHCHLIFVLYGVARYNPVWHCHDDELERMNNNKNALVFLESFP